MFKFVLCYKQLLFCMGSPILYLRHLTAEENVGLSKKLKALLGLISSGVPQKLRKREKGYVIHVIIKTIPLVGCSEIRLDAKGIPLSTYTISIYPPLIHRTS